MTNTLLQTLKDQSATERLAEQLAEVVSAGNIVSLSGDLGAGKSTFARAFIRAAAMDIELDVPSPTFTLVQSYDHADGTTIYHTDLYRLENEDDVYDLGMEEERDSAIFLVEWPDRLPDDWRSGALELSFAIDEQELGRRQLTVSWTEPEWAEKLRAIFDL